MYFCTSGWYKYIMMKKNKVLFFRSNRDRARTHMFSMNFRLQERTYIGPRGHIDS